MASEIRVDKINSLSGVGTVTLSPTGVDISGITTVQTLKVGTGVTASEDGDIFFTGVCTATTFAGSGANLTALPAANLSGTLPAISAANLTNVPAANITGTLPAISAANLTSIPAANVTGTLPALTAANLTNIPAANLVGVCTSGLTKTGGFGKILGQYYSTATTEFTSNSGSFQNAHTITFTPASSTSKFLIVYEPARLQLGGSTDGEIRFSDGTSASQQYRIAYAGSGYKQPCMHFWHNYTRSGSTTFTCQTRDISGQNDDFMVGDNGSPSVIIVLEIAQ